MSEVMPDIEDAEANINNGNNIEEENYKKQILDILKAFTSDEDMEKKARYSDNEYRFIVETNTINNYMIDKYNIYAITGIGNDEKLKEFCGKFDFRNINCNNNFSLLKQYDNIRIVIGNHNLREDEIEQCGFICIDRILNHLALQIVRNSRSKQGKGLEEIIKFVNPLIETVANNTRISEINFNKGG